MLNMHLLDESIKEKELTQETGPLRIFYLDPEAPDWSDRLWETLEIKGL